MKMPFVTGQDAEVPSIKSILAGEQYSTIYKDTRELAKITAQMIDAMLSGKEVPVNDTKTYNNEVKVVPSYLLTPVAVDAELGEDPDRRRLLQEGADHAVTAGSSASRRARPGGARLRFEAPIPPFRLASAPGWGRVETLEITGFFKLFSSSRSEVAGDG